MAESRNYRDEKTSPRRLEFYEDISWDIDDEPLSDVIKKLNTWLVKLESEGWCDITVEVRGDDCGFMVDAHRMETEEECEARNRSAADEFKKAKDERYQKWLELKKEFDND
ncbi:MAG: hypothetical protein ACYTBJ_17715 [Planctomycetota bacterium]|jgi:hypothetical protein